MLKKEDELKSNTLKEEKLPNLSGCILANVNCSVPYSRLLQTKKNREKTAYEIKQLQTAKLQ